jgi:hypothetical protein
MAAHCRRVAQGGKYKLAGVHALACLPEQSRRAGLKSNNGCETAKGWSFALGGRIFSFHPRLAE